MMRPGRPDLVAAHHEMIALQGRAAHEAREIRAGARLGIALRPDHRSHQNGRQMLRLLGGGSKFHEDRADMIEALRRQRRRADARELLRHDDLFIQRGTHSAVLGGPMGRNPTLRESVRYHGINSAGGGRTVRPRSTAGRLASSQVRTCMRNSASAGVSRRNMAMRLNADGEGDQSTLMLAALTTAVHLASSSESNLPNSAGVPILISAPSFASSSRVRGGARLSRNAALSLSMMALGVPAGATTPSQNGACSAG